MGYRQYKQTNKQTNIQVSAHTWVACSTATLVSNQRRCRLDTLCSVHASVVQIADAILALCDGRHGIDLYKVNDLLVDLKMSDATWETCKDEIIDEMIDNW